MLQFSSYYQYYFNATLNSGGVEVSPTTINQLALLKVYAFVTTTIPSGGYIKVTFPSVITTQPSTTCSFTSPTGITVSCSYSTLNSQILLTAKISGGSISNYFELNVQNFKNPSSTLPTSSFSIQTYDTNQNLLDSQTNSITLTATTDAPTSASLTSSSKNVGVTGQQLTVTLQIKNQIPINGKVYVTFPYWNPDASGTQYTLQSYLAITSTTASCQGLVNVAFNPTCTFDSSSQTLTLTNGFSGSTVAQNTTLSFIINNFKNPITTQTVSGFTVSTGDSSTGLIDSASLTLQMSQVGSISSSTVKTGVTTVQELTQYRIEFMVPVPLSQGCQLQIQFPSQITLDPSQISLVQAFGLPSTQRTISGTIDKTSNSYSINNACPSYRDDTNSAIVYFTNIQNPNFVMTTSSIEIYIYDQNSQMLLSTSGLGPTLTTTSGTINISNLSSDLTQINSLTAITFQLQPLHFLTAGSKIVIYLPMIDLTVQSTCSLTSISLLSTSAVCTTDQTNNLITITNSFDSSYTYSSTQFIKFKVSQIQLPPSTASTGTVKYQTYTLSSGTFNLVDQSNASNLIQATQGMLAYGICTPTSTLANQVTSYKFQFAISDSILKGGYIILDFPSQLSIPDLTKASCSNFINFQSTATCTFLSNQVNITQGFATSAFTDKSLELSFTVGGIQNPRSKQTTSSFKITTYAADGSLIDSRNDQMTVTMTDTQTVSTASVIPNNLVVGSVNTYTFTFSAPTPLITGDYLVLTFPSQLNQALSNTLQSCSGITNLASTLSCSINGAYGLKVRLAFTITMTSNAQFSFSVSAVANPGSGDASSLFQAEIYDSNMYEVDKNNPNLSNFYVQMAQGSQFNYIVVTHQSAKPFIQTAFTITFQIVNTLPANGRVQILYPAQITANTTNFACTVSLYGANPICTIDTTRNIILIKQATNVDLAAGTTYTITIQGLINSKQAKATDSFQVLTQTSDGQIINYAYQYLSVTNECDYPCFTCNSTSTSSCLTCDISSSYSLLLNRQCVANCPNGYYSTTGQCLQCDSSCSQCSLGPKNCTKCSAGLYLQGYQCLSSCTSSQYIQDTPTMSCLPCQSPCGTCQTKVNYCTSCLENTNQKYLYNSFCYSSCPLGSFLSQDNQTCQSCDQNCLSCQNSATTCTSCNTTLKLSKYDYTCVTTCPAQITVDTGTTCEYCDSTCKTCSQNNSKQCLSCNAGLSLYSGNNTCLGQCPTGTVTVTDISTQESTCQSCDPGCSTCQNTQRYCTQCNDLLGYLFYNFSCSTSCPTGYTRLNSTKNVCVKIGVDCPYGYAYNDFGVCSLVFQICQPGYVLNSDKSKCIPVPGAYVPIIFLIVCLPWTIFVLVKYRKTYSKIEIITLLLSFYTVIQTLEYLILLGLSLSLDYFMIKAFHILTYISMYLVNFTFGVYFHHRLRKEDQPFRHWYTQYKTYYNIYKYLLICFHFKSARLYYSKLIPQNLPRYPRLQKHHEAFDAAFGDKYHTLVKPLFYATVINFVVQVLPIILMDIYGFIFITWGYQLMVTGIDNIVLGILIFILEIIEFTHFKKLAIEEGNLIQPSFTHQYLKKINDDNVMSVIEDDSMMGLNKYGLNSVPQEHRDISLDEITKQILNHEKGKKNKFKIETKDGPTEKSVLEKLVRRMKEEQKFNKIYQNEEDGELDDFSEDIEKIGASRQKYLESLIPQGLQPSLQTQQPPSSKLLETQPRNQVQNARERLENKLSFRVVPEKGTHLTPLQEKIYKDLKGQLFPNNLSLLGQMNAQDSYNQSLIINNNQYVQSQFDQNNQSNYQQQQLLPSFQDQSVDMDDSRVILVNRSLRDLDIPNNQLVSDSRTQEQQAIDSARTEKFYQEPITNNNQEENLLRQKDDSSRPSQTNKGSKTKRVQFNQDDLLSQPIFGDIRGRSVSFHATKQADQGTQIEIPLHLIDFDEPRRNVEEFHKFKKEFKEKLDVKDEDDYQEYLYKPEWHSCDDEIMREWYDDIGPESDFDPSEISHISFPDNQEKLRDPEYLARLELFRELMKSKFHFNNCYTQLTDPKSNSKYNQGKTKNVTRRTQTYEKDIAIGYDPFEKDDTFMLLMKEELIAEIDEDYAKVIIDGIIELLSEEESFIEMKQDTLPDGVAAEDSDDFDFEKMKQSKKRKKDIQFDIDDIMGMFDIDDFGNIQLNTDTMRDNLNRKVNKNGYLIDNDRNIINQEGDIIFEAEELDEDEEIPMPYRFEKRKKQLLKQEEKFAVDANNIKSDRGALFDLDEILQNEEDKIEEEYQKLRNISRPSSQDSLIGDLPNKFDKNNLDRIDNDDQDKLISISPTGANNNQFLFGDDDEQSAADKRAKELAKAYGGKPPKDKKVKKKKSQRKKRPANEDRLPTERTFSYLDQEEERVKRMAMISYQIQNNNPPKPLGTNRIASPKAAVIDNNQSDFIEEEQTEQQLTKDFEQFFREQMQEIQQYRIEAKQQYQQKVSKKLKSVDQQQNTFVPQIPPESMFQGYEQEQEQRPLQQIEFYTKMDNMSDQMPDSQLRRMDSAATDQVLLSQEQRQHPQTQQQPGVASDLDINQTIQEEDSKQNEEQLLQQQEVDHMKDLIDQDAQRANRFFDRMQVNKGNNSALQNYSNSFGNAKYSAQTIRNQQRLHTQGGIINPNISGNAHSNLNFHHANPQLNQLQQTQSVLSMSTIPLNTLNPIGVGNFQGMGQSSSQNINNGFYSGQIQQNNLLSNFDIANQDDIQSFNHVMPQQQQQQQQSSTQLRKFDFYLPIQKNLATSGPKVKNKLQKNKETKDISFSLIGRMQMNQAAAGNNNQSQNVVSGESGSVASSRIKGLERVYLQKYPGMPKTLIHEQAQIKKKIGGQFRSNTIGDQSQMMRTAYNQNQAPLYPQSTMSAHRDAASGTGGVRFPLNKDLLEFDAVSSGNQPIIRQRQDNFINEDNNNAHNNAANNIQGWF